LRELLTALHLGTLSLQTLIDNLLEGASIETGQFRVSAHPAQLTDIINTVLLTLKPLFEKYHQTVQLECPAELPDVLADTRRSEQALVNLLANAIKWNTPAGTVTIRVESIALPNQALGSNLKVTITDQGPGLPAQTNALFQRFGHFDDHRSRAQAGAGLGLSVVKAIITAQGGSVGAENIPTGGASFWLTFRVVETGA
jgi:signal transduction histidine kinase